MSTIVEFSRLSGRSGRGQATRADRGAGLRSAPVLVAGSLALDPGARQTHRPEPPALADERAALGLLWEIESVQAAFYAELERRSALDEAIPDRASVRAIRLQERQHLAWLRSELAWYGGRPAPGRFRFDDVGAGGVRTLAGELAEWAVAAYLAAVPALRERELVAAALGILCVETRRAAYRVGEGGASPLLDVGDEAADPAGVLAAIGRYRVG